MGEVLPIKGFRDNTRSISDTALLAACAKGDTGCLGTLFDRYHKAVYRFLARLQGARIDDLDDLVQSTFLEVFRGAARFKGRSAVRVWIFGIAVNVWRHHVRGESRRRSLIKRVSELPEPISESPESIAHRHERLDALVRALDGLPQKLKVVFVICDLEGLSGPEAARVLSIRQGTLWRRLHEARKLLAAAIERRHA